SGPADVTATTVRMALTGIVFVSADPAVAFDPATGTWTIGAVANGATRELVLTVRMADLTGSVAAFTSSATPPDPNPMNNAVSLSVLPAGVIPVNSVCHLREAIIAANTDAPFGGCVSGVPGLDTIVLPPFSVIEYQDVYEDPGGLIGPNQLPAITSPIVIEG